MLATPLLHTCVGRPETNRIAAMKLLSSVAIHLLIAAVLAVGLIMMVHGKPALLIAGVLGYIVLLGKVGCASH